MTTRLDLRTALRRRLEDSGGSPLWDDATLNDALANAVLRYGSRFPAQRSAIAMLAAGATSAVVAPAIEGRQVVRVLDPNGAVVPRQPDDAAADWTAPAQSWRWWNATLLLASPALAGNWQIDYLGARTPPSDDVTAVDIIAGDDEIVVLLAGATALRRRAVEDAKRGSIRDAAAIDDAAGAWEDSAERLMALRRRRATGGWLNR